VAWKLTVVNLLYFSPKQAGGWLHVGWLVLLLLMAMDRKASKVFTIQHSTLTLAVRAERHWLSDRTVPYMSRKYVWTCPCTLGDLRSVIKIKDNE
jgi:hypothetical protein